MLQSNRILSTITTGLLVVSLFVARPFSALAANTIDFDITEEARNQDLPTADIPGASASSNVFKQAFADLIGSILSIVISIAFIMLLIYLIWGGFAWITSSGDKGKLDEARNRMSTAVIGIIVLSSVIALFMLVQQMLGICVLDFWATACVAPPAALPVPTPTP
ncbi:MAG TPA: hypothetical protein PKJ26_00485 [Candidatus Woesebacteria bacterium]|nr:hypothetical protein [Candidatus Woesebacteria bacterium]HNS64954.1 hypothetical protein [Candidatus Woesebacteria bacterium]